MYSHWADPTPAQAHPWGMQARSNTDQTQLFGIEYKLCVNYDVHMWRKVYGPQLPLQQLGVYRHYLCAQLWCRCCLVHHACLSAWSTPLCEERLKCAHEARVSRRLVVVALLGQGVFAVSIAGIHLVMAPILRRGHFRNCVDR